MKKTNVRKAVNIHLCAIVLLCISPVALAEWFSDADAGIRHDSNINNAQMSPDILSASALLAGVSATGYFPLENGNSVSVTGEARGESYDCYTGLNNISLGATLALRKKWALGPFAPWTGLSFSSAHLNYANNIRNGWRHQVVIRGGERVSERLKVRGEYMYERRTANTLAPDQPGISGDTFSQKNHSLTLNTEYTLDESIFLTGGVLLRRGDVVATASETANMIASSEAISADLVFGNPHLYAYKLNGTTHGLDLGFNVAIARNHLLRVSISRFLTHTTGDNNYAKTVQMVSWNYDF